MILSRGRNYIFIHIPKTGGTSLALALEAHAMKDDILLGDTPKAKRRRRRVADVRSAGRLWKHSRLCDLPGLVPEAQLSEFFVFTLIRNPFSRVVSYYHWLRQQRFDHSAVTLAKGLPFRSFATHPDTLASLAQSPYPSYVTLPNGQEHCHSYIRLEHLQTDLEPVRAHLGFKLDNIPHINQSVRPQGYRDTFDTESRAAIELACSADIARFGYVF